ncbi:MAG: septum formation protein Maf, partial [Sphingomonadales bacterium]|nr:septum formation protein Maf [Sphingomonadales bacterium]
MKLILASGSASRRTMLEAAGVAFAVERPNVDEDAAKASLLGSGTAPRDVADALAQLKAVKVSAREPAALVLGSDSVVELADGTMLDKPTSRQDAADHLRRMSGKRSRLHSAAVMVEGGRPVWREVDTAQLFVRPLSDVFIEA